MAVKKIEGCMAQQIDAQRLHSINSIWKATAMVWCDSFVLRKWCICNLQHSQTFASVRHCFKFISHWHQGHVRPFAAELLMCTSNGFHICLHVCIKSKLYHMCNCTHKAHMIFSNLYNTFTGIWPMLLAIAPTPQWTLHFLVLITAMPSNTRLPSRACFGAAHYPKQGYPAGPTSAGQMHSHTVQCKVTNKGPTPMRGCIALHYPVQGTLSSAKTALSSTAVQGGGLHFPAQLQHYPVQGPLSSGEHYQVQGWHSNSFGMNFAIDLLCICPTLIKWALMRSTCSIPHEPLFPKRKLSLPQEQTITSRDWGF